ncbi:MAG: hypothetical protein C5B50_25870 [Verrucomicrobia bacterium]|nr:MAG: hypothetical protein C5B50_25870 [Verrucomicrobiota bacterium]
MRGKIIQNGSQRLHETQLALAQALLGVGPIPKGFDATQVALAATAMRIKRMHSAARTWPELARHLGEDYGLLFAEYAATHPVQRTPRADVLEFGQFLAQRHKLPQPFKRLVRRLRLLTLLGQAR